MSLILADVHHRNYIITHMTKQFLVLFGNLQIFWGHESFLWGHWYPCFGLLVMSPHFALGLSWKVEGCFSDGLACKTSLWVFGWLLSFTESRVASLICTWLRHTWCTFSDFLLWYNTCWPLDSQHGSWAVLIHVLVNKHWWGSRPGSVMSLPHSMKQDRCSTDWAMPVWLQWR